MFTITTYIKHFNQVFLQSNLDSSDENNTMIVCNENFEFPCDNICLSREKVMDGTHDCKNKMDENITLECHKNFEFRCRANGRCIPRFLKQ